MVVSSVFKDKHYFLLPLTEVLKPEISFLNLLTYHCTFLDGYPLILFFSFKE